MLHIKSAKYVADYTIWLAFDDGTSGEVDLNGELHVPVFKPLKDIAIFWMVSVDPEFETVVWPTGTDLAPEFLKGLHSKQSQQTRAVQLLSENIFSGKTIVTVDTGFANEVNAKWQKLIFLSIAFTFDPLVMICICPEGLVFTQSNASPNYTDWMRNSSGMNLNSFSWP
ncbi:hypothetical protein GCM10010919_14290 [Alishewanella longhuensis]|uniref:DUF2442 domain-containing protein n=1 Tax=Alishewanella longhuensis TaxID=1091037 RepID=A0ABQ3KYX6_9ALTE|nr:DUF2442 domain-containing protein [Alishewanella longhuensis]GHG66530.1 hypothetical protein GCM10010919_14290 [Alishewanella longhuensis]